MSKTRKILPQRSTLGASFFALATRDQVKLRRGVMKPVVTSDSAGGLCAHPVQPSLEDCGWGVRLETLTLRQGDGGWEVVENYLEANEEVLAVLRDWSDLDFDLDCRLAAEIKAKEDAREKRFLEFLKRLKTPTAAPAPVPPEWYDDDDDDDFFWG